MLKKREKNEEGQALIEFIMLVPIVLAFLWYLVHVSMAINKSVVGQKHVRSQLFLKMYNHRSGPVLSDFNGTVRSHYYLGISGEVMGGTGVPVAPTEKLGVGMNPPTDPRASDDPGEPTGGSLRQNVRVRTVFGICTHRKKVPDTGLQTDFCGSESAAD